MQGNGCCGAASRDRSPCRQSLCGPQAPIMSQWISSRHARRSVTGTVVSEPETVDSMGLSNVSVCRGAVVARGRAWRTDLPCRRLVKTVLSDPVGTPACRRRVNTEYLAPVAGYLRGAEGRVELRLDRGIRVRRKRDGPPDAPLWDRRRL